MQTTVDNTASRQWANRPDDQRFLSLEELHAFTSKRAEGTHTFNHKASSLKAFGSEPAYLGDKGELVVLTNQGPLGFSNWSMNQLAQSAGAPASYLRKLSSPLAAACLNEGLVINEKENMLQSFEDGLRCLTSTTYGRIWDHDVVAKVREVVDGTSWKIPSASYAATNPKRATTLYASDRDIFLFLVDEDHPVELPGRDKPSFRGFYAWNSEVGSQTFGLAAFLYDYVCDNRNIWGVSNKTELRIKHSSGAPERFLQEGRKALIEYSNQSTEELVAKVQRAQNRSVGSDEDEVTKFLQKRGLTLGVAKAAVAQAVIDDGDLNAWTVTNGITAYARTIKHQDSRIAVERMAGKIMEDI